MENKREKLSSRLGFIFLSAGCAIGLGNIWRFPYMVGKYGGGAFVLVYLFFLVLLGLPIIVMDHQPGELSEASDAGVDLDLSGHTHDGQMFPANLVVHFLWENACGVLKKGAMTSIVTSGAGVWGPAMRVGTNNEVVIANVSFDPATDQ